MARRGREGQRRRAHIERKEVDESVSQVEDMQAPPSTRDSHRTKGRWVVEGKEGELELELEAHARRHRSRHRSHQADATAARELEQKIKHKRWSDKAISYPSSPKQADPYENTASWMYIDAPIRRSATSTSMSAVPFLANAYVACVSCFARKPTK